MKFFGNLFRKNGNFLAIFGHLNGNFPKYCLFGLTALLTNDPALLTNEPSLTNGPSDQNIAFQTNGPSD